MKKSWLKAWIVQFAVMIAACLAAEFTYYISAVLRSVLLWALIPILGAVTAYRCVLKGLNNYAAWIAPPLLAELPVTVPPVISTLAPLATDTAPPLPFTAELRSVTPSAIVSSAEV